MERSPTANPPEGPDFAADLRRYLEHKRTVFPPEIREVLADLNRFVSSILREGFPAALTQRQIAAPLGSDRSFLEVCNAIIEHHLRVVAEGDRELIGKSLFEAYVYLAGPQNVFEPASKTRAASLLRRRGPKGFAVLFLSLHLFNVVCKEIQDDVRARMPDQQSFEFYMLGVEALCRDIVTAATTIPESKPEDQWAATACTNIDAHLLGWQ